MLAVSNLIILHHTPQNSNVRLITAMQLITAAQLPLGIQQKATACSNNIAFV